MRLREILAESDNGVGDIIDDLTTLLSILNTKGETSVPCDYIVGVLQSYGHNVDTESIMSIATQSPLVQSATSDTIEIKDSNGTDAEQAGEDEEAGKEMVSQMAQDTAMGELQQ